MLVMTSWRGPFRDHLVFFPTATQVSALAEQGRPFDAFRVRQALDRPDDARASRVGEDWTQCVDLTQERDALLAGMTKNSQYEVRRAEKLGDRLRLRRNDAAAIDDFARLLSDFIAWSRYAHPLSASRYRQYLRVADVIVAYIDGAPVVGHLLLRDPDAARVRLTFSASVRYRETGPLRALIAPANRWLHWMEFVTYASEGYSLYDFGGANAGSGIGRFKASLGGVMTRGWNAEVTGWAVTPAVRAFEARRRLTQRRASRS